MPFHISESFQRHLIALLACLLALALIVYALIMGAVIIDQHVLQHIDWLAKDPAPDATFWQKCSAWMKGENLGRWMLSLGASAIAVRLTVVMLIDVVARAFIRFRKP